MRTAKNLTMKTKKIRRGIIMLAFAFCSFSGCGDAALSAVGATEDMIRLSIRYSHMSITSALSFDLEEKGGEVLFSCSFFSNMEEIKLEKVRVAPEYMQRMREIAKQHDFANMKEKSNADRPFIHDAPMYDMTMGWPDRKSLRLNYWPGGGEVEKLFWEITGALINKPGAAEDISALYYDYAHASDYERFNFSLRGDKGKFLFSARYFTEGREKIVLSGEPVDIEHVRKMRELVKELGILDVKGNPLWNTSKSAPPNPYARLNLYWPDMRILRLDESAPGGEELEKFFRGLAEKYVESL